MKAGSRLRIRHILINPPVLCGASGLQGLTMLHLIKAANPSGASNPKGICADKIRIDLLHEGSALALSLVFSRLQNRLPASLNGVFERSSGRKRFPILSLTPMARFAIIQTKAAAGSEKLMGQEGLYNEKGSLFIAFPDDAVPLCGCGFCGNGSPVLHRALTERRTLLYSTIPLCRPADFLTVPASMENSTRHIQGPALLAALNA